MRTKTLVNIGSIGTGGRTPFLWPWMLLVRVIGDESFEL